MLRLGQRERTELLRSFLNVYEHFKAISDELVIEALVEAKGCKLEEALDLMDQAIEADKVLTHLKECLTLEYMRVVSLH
jgi:hypothetical protein